MKCIGVDIHKRYCHGVIADGLEIKKEERFLNTVECWERFLSGVDDKTPVVIEASSITERVIRYLEDRNISFKVANPRKTRIIAEAAIKTDRIAAKRLIELNSAGLIPEAWVPPRRIRDLRHLCRYRSFLVRMRTCVKNRIHVELDREDLNVTELTYGYLEEVKHRTIMLSQLYQTLREINQKIKEVEKLIDDFSQESEDAKIIDTIPGISRYGALLLASEIGDVNRFSNSAKLSSYAGLVPTIYQSGTREWRGRITKEGNKWIRWCLEECIAIHCMMCPESPIAQYYYKLKKEKGASKARVAASRRLLCVIYHMLTNKMEFQDYMKKNNTNPSFGFLQK